MKRISTLRFRPSQNPEKAKAIVIDKCAANLQIKLQYAKFYEEILMTYLFVKLQ